MLTTVCKELDSFAWMLTGLCAQGAGSTNGLSAYRELIAEQCILKRTLPKFGRKTQDFCDARRQGRTVSTLTIFKNKVLMGTIGGHRCNTNNRAVMRFEELKECLQYSLAVNLVCLGDGHRAVIMEQLRGVAMGGRS